MTLDKLIDKENIPKHVAIIMDGNGRWAKKKGNNRLFGHKNGVTAVKETTEAAATIGIKHLTLYAFSTENWNRPKMEVDGLMSLLVSAIENESKTLMKNQVRLTTIGDTSQLPNNVQIKLQDLINKTSDNKGLNLNLALNYSGKWDILNAVQNITKAVKNDTLDIEQINYDTISEYLSTKNMPDPDLLIRTSGEYRLSNFLLWELAYAEFIFTDTLWPDFRKENLYQAILDFQKRERRFGQISEQIINPNKK